MCSLGATGYGAAAGEAAQQAGHGAQRAATGQPTPGAPSMAVLPRRPSSLASPSTPTLTGRPPPAAYTPDDPTLTLCTH